MVWLCFLLVLLLCIYNAAKIVTLNALNNCECWKPWFFCGLYHLQCDVPIDFIILLVMSSILWSTYYSNFQRLHSKAIKGHQITVCKYRKYVGWKWKLISVTSWPLVWKTWKCPGIWQLSGKWPNVRETNEMSQKKSCLWKCLLVTSTLGLHHCLVGCYRPWIFLLIKSSLHSCFSCTGTVSSGNNICLKWVMQHV